MINNHILEKNNLTFIDLNSSISMRITVNKRIIIKIHMCFPELLKNLEEKHDNGYVNVLYNVY